MRKMTMNQIDEAIKKNRKEANEQIRQKASSNRSKKSRTRTKDEITALNEISIARWNKAVASGKIKYLGERRLYYDYT